jgi:hypothetical protein
VLNSSEDAHHKDVSTFEIDEHLQILIASLLTTRIKSRKLLTAKKVDDLLGQPAALFDPSANSRGVGSGDDTSGLRGARRLTGAGIVPSRGVKAEHRPTSDTDTITGDRAQHECQADRQGPSMTIRSPDCRMRAKAAR